MKNLLTKIKAKFATPLPTYIRVKHFDASAISDMTRNVNAFLAANPDAELISFRVIHVNHVNNAWFFMGGLVYKTTSAEILP